jgi:hypothetical protein
MNELFSPAGNGTAIEFAALIFLNELQKVRERPAADKNIAASGAGH